MATIQKPLEEFTIVDTDSHMNDCLEDFISHFHESDKGIKKLCEQAADPSREILPAGDRPTPGFMQGWLGKNKSNIEAKREFNEEFNIEYSILTTGRTTGISRINNPRYQAAIARAYNSWLFDEFSNANRLKYLISVPPAKPDLAAKEITRCMSQMESKVAGVALPPNGLIPLPGSEHYDPIYETAQNNDLPIVFHSASSGCFPSLMKHHETYFESHTINHPLAHMQTLTSLIAGAVPERFPDLDFVLQEAGLGYIPYMKWRLDDHYLEFQHDVPGLLKMPSEYIERQFYFSTQPLGDTRNNPEYMANIIDMIGPESILFSTDHPHPDFDTPRELFDRISPFISSGNIKKMMGENAMKIFGLN
jgi:predicted TIM-barrel fold metal-dependent hydrolase